eukprot:gene14412-9781_t
MERPRYGSAGAVCASEVPQASPVTLLHPVGDGAHAARVDGDGPGAGDVLRRVPLSRLRVAPDPARRPATPPAFRSADDAADDCGDAG